MTAASRSAACLSLPGMACAYQLSVMLASAWPQSVRENRLRALGRWPCEVARAAVGVYHTGCGAPAYRAASCVDYPASFPRARRVFLLPKCCSLVSAKADDTDYHREDRAKRQNRVRIHRQHLQSSRKCRPTSKAPRGALYANAAPRKDARAWEGPAEAEPSRQ